MIRSIDLAQPALLVALVAASVGCADDFRPYSELNALRVLAVRAEPPEPAPGESSSLSALVYSPTQAEPNLSWSWCPLPLGGSFGSDCSIEEQAIREALSAVGDVGPASLSAFDLGSDRQASFQHALSPALTEALCLAVNGQQPADVPCRDGLPITIVLRASDGVDQVVASKRLLLRSSAVAERNRNPEVAAIRMAPSDEGDATDLARLDGEIPLVAAGGTDLKLHVEATASQAEGYVELSPFAEQKQAAERLVVSWFVNAGETQLTRSTAGPASAGGGLLAASNTWTLPDSEAVEGSDAEIYVVMRDGRGGTGWASGRVQFARPE